MVKDFTPESYSLLLSVLEERGYMFYTFERYMSMQPEGSVILRHDVDRHPGRSLDMAELEHHRNIAASYHFRVTSGKQFQSQVPVLEKIISMGHEIAYHYEDLSRALYKIGRSHFARIGPEDFLEGVRMAKESFAQNLELLRQYYPVRVISMHGDPLSSCDNRKLWDHMNYSDYGIICEPYLDLDYSSVTYLTDTGRRWDADGANRRDRIPGSTKMADLFAGQPHATTFQIISLIRSGIANGPLVINTHPQRWSGNLFVWLRELITQSIKNPVKSLTRK
ncbi:MAG TPA: hypothetical protein PLV06_14020 [Bacteroidales bacterium]|nr:hypothetical protein [Bacteroidales bacterium]